MPLKPPSGQREHCHQPIQNPERIFVPAGDSDKLLSSKKVTPSPPESENFSAADIALTTENYQVDAHFQTIIRQPKLQSKDNNSTFEPL